MLRFLFQALLTLFTLRVVIALGRYLSRGAPRRQAPRGRGGEKVRGPGRSGSARPGQSVVDRSSVIDVPYTEEKADPK